MEFGFISIDWDNEALKIVGEKLHNSGFTWMEIHYPKYTDGEDFFREYLKINRNLINKYHPKLSLHLPAGDINPASFNRAIRSESLHQLKEAIDFGEDIGASILVMHPGEVKELDFPEEGYEIKFEDNRNSIIKALDKAWKLNIDSITECANYAKENGMKLTVENIFSHEALVRTPQHAKKFLEDVNNSNVYFTLDVGHSFRAGIEPAKFIEILGKKIIHLHLNDNDGSCDLHLPLCKGTIDFIPVLNSLKKIGYQVAFIFEISSNNSKDFINSKNFLENLMT